jgi:hypothetical protein
MERGFLINTNWKEDNRKSSEDDNIIPIVLKESKAKAGEIKITFLKPNRKQKNGSPSPVNLRKLVKLKHQSRRK